MQISKEFLTLFKDFVDNYKRNGAPAFLSWYNERDYLIFCEFLENLHHIISDHLQAFNDTDIIRYVNDTTLRYAKSNPYLLKTWVDILDQYNRQVPQEFSPIGSIHIADGQEERPLAGMIRSLKSALLATQEELHQERATHKTEVEEYKRQIAELSRQNIQLKELLLYRQKIEELHPQLQTAQEQLTSMIQIFSQILRPMQTPSAADATDVKSSTATALFPPPPPPPPVLMHVPVATKSNSPKEAVRPTSMTLTDQSFFSRNSQLADGVQLHTEINAMLRKLKPTTTERETKNTPDTDEKKKGAAKDPQDLLIILRQTLDSRRLDIAGDDNEVEEDNDWDWAPK